MKRIFRNIAIVVIGIFLIALLLNFCNRAEYGQDLLDRTSIFSNNLKHK